MPTPTTVSQSSKNRASRTAILHLSPNLEPDEPGRETVDLAILTQRSGWRALIASAGGRLVNDAERAAVRHRRMPLDGHSLFGDWRSRLQLEALVKKERPALLHAHGIETLPFACAISRSHRIPFIADLTQPVPDHPRMHRLMADLKSVPSIVRVPSEFMARHLIETFKLEDEHIRPIPPGIDLQWYGAGFISAERLQKMSHLLRLPEQASVVLVPLPLSAGMGHKIFLEAMAGFKNENVFIVLVGSDRKAPGPRAEIENLVDQLGLGGKVVMPEFFADLPATCWLANIIVAPNIAPRGQNLELLAAQAIGRPVIVTRTGANPELVASGETAWVVPPNDVKALADAIREAIQLDTGQRLNLAERTHNFIAENFPQGAWFNGMMGLYESMLRPAERTARSMAA
jgi:glycosyltransferase involved in cell wall biosynthesis